MNGIWLMLFALAAGFTASGIAANLYRMSGIKPDDAFGWGVRVIAMTVAGPSIIFETAMRGYIDKKWQPLTFWLVTCAILYWSFALGLFIVDLAVVI